MRATSIFVSLILAASVVSSAAIPASQPATDWPQFRGQNRDGVSLETGLLKKWPEGGPKLLWKMEGLGNGLSAPAVIGNKAYVLGGLQQKKPMSS